MVDDVKDLESQFLSDPDNLDIANQLCNLRRQQDFKHYGESVETWIELTMQSCPVGLRDSDYSFARLLEIKALAAATLAIQMNSRDNQQRATAACVVSNNSELSDILTNAVVRALVDPEPQVRYMAQQALRNGTPGLQTAAIPQLHASLGDSFKAEFALPALDSLPQTLIEPLLPHVLELLQSSMQPEVQITAARTLGAFGEAIIPHRQTLLITLQGNDPELQEALLLSLQRLGPKAEPFHKDCLDLLPSISAYVRPTLINFLALFPEHSEQHVEHFINGLDSDSLNVQYGAFKTLIQTSPKARKTQATAIQFSDHDNEHMRLLSTQALGQAQGDDSEQVTALFKRLLDGNAHIQKAALHSLRQIEKTTEALDFLKQQIDSDKGTQTKEIIYSYSYLAHTTNNVDSTVLSVLKTCLTESAATAEKLNCLYGILDAQTLNPLSLGLLFAAYSIETESSVRQTLLEVLSLDIQTPQTQNFFIQEINTTTGKTRELLLSSFLKLNTLPPKLIDLCLVEVESNDSYLIADLLMNVKSPSKAQFEKIATLIQADPTSHTSQTLLRSMAHYETCKAEIMDLLEEKGPHWPEPANLIAKLLVERIQTPPNS